MTGAEPSTQDHGVIGKRVSFRNQGFLGAALLLLAVVGYLYPRLCPEILDPPPYFNDNVLHLSLVREAAGALEHGEDPTDFWYSLINEGYPLFHHYQHLPHVVLAGLHHVLGDRVPVETLFRGSTLLLLFLFPFSVAWSVWRLGCGRRAGAFAGVAAVLLSTRGLYGLDLCSFGWGGFGLTTQLWGMVMLGPAWALSRRALQEGGRVVPAAALLAALLLTHTVLGYVAILSTVIFLFSGGMRGLAVRCVRLALILALVGTVASYFLVPFLRDREAMNRSVWEKQDKYDSYGHEEILKKFMGRDPATGRIKGALLDEPMFANRFPVLTLLLGLGLVVSLFCWRRPGHRSMVLLFVCWLLLYFGRPTWGRLLDLLPLSADLHFHRLIAPVHLAGAGLAGVGIAALWKGGEALWNVKLKGSRASPLLVPVLVLLTAAGLLQAILERENYIAKRCEWRKNNLWAFRQDRGRMDQLLWNLAAQTPGRVYAGRGANWGNTYRIGGVPVYALLTLKGLDNLGYLYHALSLNADVDGYMDEAKQAHYNLFNVRFVVAPAGRAFPDFVRLLETHGSHRLYAVETRGYFDLVDAPVAFAGTKEEWFPLARDWLGTDLVEKGHHPVLFVDQEPAVEFEQVFSLAGASERLPGLGGDPGGRGTVRDRKIRPGRYEAFVEVKRPCYLMLKSTYHPGWRVRVDGKPVKPVMLAPAFVGVPVTPGVHDVVFHYQPGALRRFLFWLGLAVLCAAAAAERLGWLRRVEAIRLSRKAGAA